MRDTTEIDGATIKLKNFDGVRIKTTILGWAWVIGFLLLLFGISLEGGSFSLKQAGWAVLLSLSYLVIVGYLLNVVKLQVLQSGRWVTIGRANIYKASKLENELKAKLSN